MNTQLQALIIEDDPAVSNGIASFLQHFLTIRQAFDGLSGQSLALENIFDIIILDVMLPQRNGLDVLKTLREQHLDTPVLLLTAKSTLTDKVHGFEFGADDYLTKPFHREELLLRIKALLKRSGRLSDDGYLTLDDLVLNLNNRTASVEQASIQLNGKEFDLLTYLLQNQNIILTKAQIFDRIWGFDSQTGMTVVEVYMSNLRKKLKAVHKEQLIVTVRNVGYLLKTEVLS